MKKERSKWLIVANWKMNPVHLKEAVLLMNSTKKTANTLRNTETVVCPPFIFLEKLKTSGHRCVLGAQDTFYEPEGSFTGNISYLQLKNLGIKFVILGHSERRAMGETNEMVNLKVKSVLKGVMTPIICIGESKRDEKGAYLEVIKNQIQEALAGLPKNSAKDVVIAYEPLWAIGKTATRQATTKEIFEVSIFIKKIISDLYEMKSVPPTKILYGGSVDEKNTEEILKESGVDGLLVGRASLDGKRFGQILKISDSVKR